MIYELSHPLKDHKISLLRSTDTNSKLFRELTNELTQMLLLEATKTLPLTDIPVTTPLKSITGKKIATDITIIPILRAGLGMLNACLETLPFAKSGFIGLARNEETLEPETYYEKFPAGMKDDQVFLVDPMLATGGSLVAAIEYLEQAGIKQEQITVLALLAAPEGIKTVEKKFKGPVFVAQIDENLNEKGYIVPGLGDAGDRIFKS
ncbi:uracil phosphoribosyltransferase [bacterium DOLZORAL124_38_8]|nr:MAG: uracil phosphoribosyltransferase [bacterium DOLZORAL124_38_8]